MRIARFKVGNNQIKYGQIFDDYVLEIVNFSYDADSYVYGQTFSTEKIKLLAPVCPGKVVALAYNYKDLVGDLGIHQEPLIFLKSPDSVIGPNEAIRIHKGSTTWSEIELAIVIGKECRNVSKEDAKNFIFGYTIANDVTMLNVNNRDHHLARSKALDTFCPLGPFVVRNLGTDNLYLNHFIGDKLYQSSNTSNRILNDAESVSLVSRFITLNPGDVLLTGTPKNAMNSVIHNNDLITMEISHIGTLKNYVKYK